MNSYLVIVHAGIFALKKFDSITRTLPFSSRRQKDKPYPKILKESGTQSKLHFYSSKCNLKKYFVCYRMSLAKTFNKVVRGVSSYQCLYV